MNRWMDSFDYAGTTASYVAQRYDAGGVNGVGATGRTDKRALFNSTGVGTVDSLTKILTSLATYIFGAAIRPSVLTAVTTLIRFKDGATVQIYVRQNADNTLSVVNGDGTVLGTTSAAQKLDVGLYTYLEFKATIHDTTGSFELRANDVSWLTGTNVDTKNSANATMDRVEFGCVGGSVTCEYDDLYINDTTGSYNNDFEKAIKIEALFPSGAGTSTNWTPNTGANYAAVDDTTPDDDTTYVAASVVTTKDTYAMGNLAATLGTIKAIQLNAYAKRDDLVNRTFAMVVRSGGTDYDGADNTVTAAYDYYSEIRETDPATSAPWTISNVNAMEAGLKVTL